LTPPFVMRDVDPTLAVYRENGKWCTALQLWLYKMFKLRYPDWVASNPRRQQQRRKVPGLAPQ
jgi:hypothetical protein